MIYPWQTETWARLQALREHWPHALLLHGQAGIGKVDFARHVAQGLLCEAPAGGGQPCGTCVACNWFTQGNHPDYRAVMPEALAAELPGAQDSDAADENGKKTRTPSKEIKIEQVRGLLDFCSVGSHRGGARVVLLYPAEALNVAASNALLKTLEEPPAGVAFLLVAARIDRLLPTILSRCRQWPMPAPAREPATQWLAAQGVAAAPAILAEAGGAPLAALALAGDEHQTLRRWLLEQLAAGPACDAFSCAETLQKVPLPLVLGWLQRWLYDLLAGQSGSAPRYYPAAAEALARCAAQVKPLGLARYLRVVGGQRAVENHPLNARLVFEEIFFGYRQIFAPVAAGR